MDWPAILDRYLFIRGQIDTVPDKTPIQTSKIFSKVGFAEVAKRSDSIFDFTNQFVMAASSYLPAFTIKSAINHLNKLGEEGKFSTSE